MAKKPDIALIDRICQDPGLTKAQRRLLHEEITGLHLSEEEILEAAIEIQQLYPNK